MQSRATKLKYVILQLVARVSQYARVCVTYLIKFKNKNNQYINSILNI